jgi:hypothetical protein
LIGCPPDKSCRAVSATGLNDAASLSFSVSNSSATGGIGEGIAAAGGIGMTAGTAPGREGNGMEGIPTATGTTAGKKTVGGATTPGYPTGGLPVIN